MIACREISVEQKSGDCPSATPDHGACDCGEERHRADEGAQNHHACDCGETKHRADEGAQNHHACTCGAEDWEQKRILDVLENCSIFDRLPREHYKNVLNCLGARRKTFQKDETILNIGENSQMAGIVLGGTMELAFWDENGNQISVNYLGPGEVFGAERACCDWNESQIRLHVITDCEILFLRFGNLLQVRGNSCIYRAQVTVNLLRDFARQTQFLNAKLRIISQKRLRDKLKVYLQTLPCGPDGSVVLPLNRRELAEYLYVDRSALSRELSRMQAEGILSFDGNKLTILRRSFLDD